MFEIKTNLYYMSPHDQYSHSFLIKQEMKYGVDLPSDKAEETVHAGLAKFSIYLLGA